MSRCLTVTLVRGVATRTLTGPCIHSNVQIRILAWTLRFALCAGVLSIPLSGCSIYHPQPLDHETVETILRQPDDQTLQVAMSQIRHPALRPVRVDLANGINADEAALVAILLNPALRADRDRRGLARAQLVQAGVLPNPQISWGTDYVIGGNTAGTVTAFGFGASWDVTPLLTLLPKIAAAKDNVKAIDLDIAWNEWQTAQGARLSVLRIAGLVAQIQAAREADDALRENVSLLRRATDLRYKTVLDLAAAEATSREAHSTVLAIEKQLETERIALNRAIGLPPESTPPVETVALPAEVTLPDYQSLVADLDNSRLDLLGLKAGYASQDETLRAAILAQVPRIGLGFTRAGDTSNVQTLGFGITLDLPIFDRNQGNIATERATRQKLFDEYANRVFQARADMVTEFANIRWLNRQIAETQKTIRTLEQLVDTAGVALAQGNADVISYYQTRFNLILKRIEFHQFKTQLAETVVGLEISAGRYLPVF